MCIVHTVVGEKHEAMLSNEEIKPIALSVVE